MPEISGLNSQQTDSRCNSQTHCSWPVNRNQQHGSNPPWQQGAMLAVEQALRDTDVYVDYVGRT